MPGLIHCLELIGLTGQVDKMTGKKIEDVLQDKIKKLVESGKHLTEAEAIVKREFINEQYKEAHDALNTLKGELNDSLGQSKIPLTKFTPLPKLDLTAVNKKSRFSFINSKFIQ